MSLRPKWLAKWVVPQVPPSLVPGRPASYWDGLRDRGYNIALVAVLGVLLGALAPDANIRGVLVYGAGFVGVLGSCIALRAVLLGYRQERREAAAGYATTRKFVYRKLWQLDPTTGEVLRRPGEASVRSRR